jgi:hypothetical protein
MNMILKKNRLRSGSVGGKKAVSFGRGYDFEEFQESMRKLWNNYLLLETEERKALVNMAKRF